MYLGNNTPDTYYTSIPTSTGRTIATGSDGVKYVLGQFNDPAGNAYYTNDSITLDTLGPILPGRSRASKAGGYSSDIAY